MTKKEFWKNREWDYGELTEVNKDVRTNIDESVFIRITGNKRSHNEVLAFYRAWGISCEEFKDGNINYIVSRSNAA